MSGEQIATAQVADMVQANVSHFEKVLDTVIDYGLKLGKKYSACGYSVFYRSQAYQVGIKAYNQGS